MAATGTPTTNIGLRRPQGTDPASVDDINYNSGVIDTKMGAVGNTSLQAQITALNSKLGTMAGNVNELKNAVPIGSNGVTFVRVSNSLMSDIFGKNRQGMFMCFDFNTGYIEIIAWDTYAELYGCSLKRSDNTVSDKKSFTYNAIT